MQQLVNLVSQRTGLSEDKARTAVDTVVNFMKERLPGGLGSQLDSVVAGGGQGEGQGSLDDLAGGLGGMLGRERK